MPVILFAGIIIFINLAVSAPVSRGAYTNHINEDVGAHVIHNSISPQLFYDACTRLFKFK